MKNFMFDCDGVLADFVLNFTRIIHEIDRSFTPYNTHQQPTWDFKFPKEVMMEAWKRVAASPSFWEDLPLLATEDEMRRIAELNQEHNLYFVTSRAGAGSAKKQTERWLSRYGIENPSVIVTPNKGQFAQTVDIDYSIDDKAGNATFVAYATRHQAKPTKSYLLNQRYNQFDPAVLGSKTIRVYTVAQFLDQVESDRALDILRKELK